MLKYWPFAVIGILVTLSLYLLFAPQSQTQKPQSAQQAATPAEPAPIKQGDLAASEGPAREVNLLTSGNDLSQKVWSPIENSRVEKDALVAPDGTKTADLLIEDSNDARHRIEHTPIKIQPGQTYCLSLFVKARERSAIVVEMRDDPAKKYGVAVFDIGKGKLVSSKGDIKSYGMEAQPDGWSKVWVAMPFETDSAVFNIQIVNSEQSSKYVGDGKSGLGIWGVRFELGEKPTS